MHCLLRPRIYLFGTGSGTYRYVSPSFQTFYFRIIFAHAESVYVETLVELGHPLDLHCYWPSYLSCSITRLFWSGVLTDLDRALGIAAISALVGQVMIAFFDFGIYQPANGIAMAILMGTAVARAVRQEQQFVLA